jgi:hypothetical protein
MTNKQWTKPLLKISILTISLILLQIHIGSSLYILYGQKQSHPTLAKNSILIPL